ncbi:hypothetical protein BB559_000089 [Furculomyces boomerangus]|uniref:beta-glucosidase n=2 Tax=Harpellales TaxID=61421 RepID=A0A2T9Z6C8_9FUNG|nr:hypothetical protein BB559_000089 [Furculomyces boomerangus]PWA03283.1 hypothetical protein BB558_000548 [Smittium angustum]
MKVSLVHYLVSYLPLIALVKGDTPLLNNITTSPPEIDVPGPKTISGVVCLPPNIVFQQFDPLKPKSVPTYSLPQYDESKVVGPTANLDADVVELLNSLTIEEKVGQMTQIFSSMFLGCDGLVNMTATIEWFDKWKIGSVYTDTATAGGYWNYNSPQRSANFTNTLQQVATTYGSKIPMIYGIDSVRGANFIKGAVIFPAPVNTAATFNPIHAYEAGRIAAKDTRAAGIQWAFGPLSDISMEKLWSRNVENFGEDPYLAGEMVYNSIRGVQGNYKMDRTRVAACMKHFIGYSAPINGKDQEQRLIPWNYLMEYIVPSFQRAVDAGVATGMESYGSLNGGDVVASKALLKDLLRDKMGFNGMMTTDFGEINSQYQKHMTAFNASDAAMSSLNYTTIDMSMVGTSENFTNATIYLVKGGVIPESRINESAGRILQLKKDLGLFEQPFSDPSLIDTVGSAQDVEVARNSARESIILHQNKNNVLPLSVDEKVLFIGPNMNSTRFLGGGWNAHWQGPTDAEGDAIYDGYGDTIMLGVQQITGKQTGWKNGFDINGNKVDNYDDLVMLARRADKVVIGFGQKTAAEVNGNINTLTLPVDQTELVKRITHETSTPTVIVLIQNQPFSLGNIPDWVDGIINAGLPGAYGGLPIAEALYGKYSPSGRQPYTYPKMDYQSKVTYFTGIWNEYDPQFAFGSGFGYNQISYSNITVSSTELRPGCPITVSVSATNNGKMSQLEPVLMYTTQNIRRRYTPEKYRLRSFDKKEILPGATANFNFTLTAEQMMFWTVELDHILEEGPVTITMNAFNKNNVTLPIYLYTS